MEILLVVYEAVHIRTDTRRISLRERRPQDSHWDLERVL